jgi:hypothetical protein
MSYEYSEVNLIEQTAIGIRQMEENITKSLAG